MTSQLNPQVVFWDCDGVLANNSEALAMPVAGIILNEAMKDLHPDAPQFDIDSFTTKYAGGHFSQFYAIAAKMLIDAKLDAQLPPEADLDILKVARTVEVLTEQALPPVDLNVALQTLDRAGLKMCVVSSSEFNRVLPCLDKISGYDFGGAFHEGGRVFSAADSMERVFGRRIVKPEPDVAFFAASAMGIGAERGTKGIAVEDSASGVTCWVRAGIPVIGYTGGDHILDKQAHGAMLKEKGAIAVFDTMADVSRHIVSLRTPAPVANVSAKAAAGPKWGRPA